MVSYAAQRSLRALRLVALTGWLIGCGSSAEPVEPAAPPAEPAAAVAESTSSPPPEARVIPRAITGPDGVLPLARFGNYAACLSRLQQGAASCGLVDGDASEAERSFSVLVLGGEHLGWFLRAEPPASEGLHRVTAIDPTNRHRVTTASFPASVGCAEPFHTDSSSGLAYSTREPHRADATRLVRARASSAPGTLEVTLTEAFPVCDPSECDCACQGDPFVRERVVELALPST